MAAEPNQNSSGNLIKKCKYCMKGFNTKKYWQKFCSSKCRYNYHNDMKVLKNLTKMEPDIGP